MTSIDKATITIGKAATVMVISGSFIVTTLTQYFTQKAAMKSAIQEIKQEFETKYQELSYENKLQDILITGQREANQFNYSLIKDLQEMVKPDEPTIKSYKR